MTGTKSALYVGRVQHRRVAAPEHAFSYRLAMCLLDLDEVEDVMAYHPLCSTRRGWPVQFRRSDYVGDPTVALGETVRDMAAARLGTLPRGPVRVLTHLRTWGWCFNPISLYYCFDPAEELQAVVASVTNTPWGERHHYVLGAQDGRVDERRPKGMHVSPFLDMKRGYHFVLEPPREQLDGRIDVIDHVHAVSLATRLRLDRRPLDRAAITSLLVRYPLMTWRVSAAIYLQAGLLRLKGAAVHRHPRRVSEPGAARR